MGNSILNIGVSGLNAAQAALVTTGHNIANVNTPGFSRQQTIQGTNTALPTGSGFIGQGTHVIAVQRQFSQVLAQQVLSAESAAEQLSAHYQQIGRIDNLLADPVAGLAPALSEAFRALQDLATNPASIASRQAALSSAEALVSRFHLLDGRLAEMREGVDRQVEASVASVNAFAAQIARLNESISLARGASGGVPPNDLLDQRDALLAELNKEILVTLSTQDDGAVNVFVGNGQPLVVGSTAGRLKAVPDPADPTRLAVALDSGGAPVVIKEDLLAGGRLGGALAFRRENLDPARNELGRIATGFAAALNDQHRLGQDLSGALGADLFRIAVPQVTPHGGNIGNATLGAVVSDASVLTVSDYRLSYDGANYTLTRLADGAASVFAGFPQTVDGVTLTLASGAAAAGDSFLIRPAVDGARDIALLIKDPVRLAAAAPIVTAAAAGNIGSGRISAGEVLGPPPPDPNLQAAVSISFNDPPTTFNITGTGTGNPVNVPYTPGATISFNGLSLVIDGAPAAGDSFSVGPNSGGVADGRNALLLAGLDSQRTLAGGTATFQSAYAQLVSRIGNAVRELEVTSAAQANLVRETKEAQQAVSGVNLDEEAANLIRFQQAYQASGRLIQIAGQLFDTLLGLGG